VYNEIESLILEANSTTMPSFYFAHELGHILGLDDEYQEFPVSLNLLKGLVGAAKESFYFLKNNIILKSELGLSDNATEDEELTSIKIRYINESFVINGIPVSVSDSFPWKKFLINGETLTYFPNFVNYFYRGSVQKDERGKFEFSNEIVLDHSSYEKYFKKSIHKVNLIYDGIEKGLKFAEGGHQISFGLIRFSFSCLMNNHRIIHLPVEDEIPVFCKVCHDIIDKKIIMCRQVDRNV